MDWQKSMNQAMEYIENNLTGKIDYQKAAMYMNCSEWEFRRIFSFLTQMSLSEYIRRRKLTMAIVDIKNKEKLICVAERYGYESQAAFSRAFRQMHGIAPSEARRETASLKPLSRLTFKLVLMEGVMAEKGINQRTNIIGAGEVGYAVPIGAGWENIHKINELFWDTKGNEIVGTTALPMYGAFVSEEKCQLLGNLENKRVLEIGCGTGQSLQYVAYRGASELWGLDISNEQIEKAKARLAPIEQGTTLICSPMEADCGIPEDYFDVIYSVYGIGWTTELEGTFKKLNSYLKRDGILIFSWSHPIHKCVASENDSLIFKKSYFDESWYSVSLGEGVLSLCDRKLSTYINALAKAGFLIEEMVEESEEDLLKRKDSSFSRKAKMLPVTFVIKARKNN